MLSVYTFILVLGFWQVVSILNCFSTTKVENNRKLANQFYTSDEIVFYSTGSSFSPVIILRGDAEVIWTWDDNTTSNSTTPTKDYGSEQLRRNSLKVTPWSAVRRINIGYDADDGGSTSIELVNDQKVSLVENLNLVAPYLQEWCSSYNKLISIDFSNFINIETIECYLSSTLQNVNLTNTPKLKRACFEENNLLSLNLSSCIALEDFRGAVNKYSTIILPNMTDNVWHLCLRDNPQITDQNLFNNLSLFPRIAELWIWNANQKGDLIIPQTNLERTVSIMAYRNKYSSVDFRGAFMNPNRKGLVYLSHNELTKIDISGCIQIIYLDLSNNKFESTTIDQILKQVDDYGTSNGTIDLRFNNPPTYIGLEYIAKLRNRGWTVNTDPNIPIESISISSSTGNFITTENGTLQLATSVLPANATTQSVTWSVIDVTGKASISTSGLLTAEKKGMVKVIATATDGSGVYSEKTITIESVSIQLSVKVMLEGANTGNSMTTLLQGYMPLMHPYNVAPWNYSGTEVVGSIPAIVVDWVLVELRQATTASEATSLTIFAKRAAFLKSDGSIVDHLTGDILRFNDKSIDPGKSLFVVIRHRNHLAIMSSSSLTMTEDVYQYDFTTSISQAYGGSTGYKITGMVAGDIDQDGNIFVSDYNKWANGFGQTNGYYGSDLNMDGDAFISDYNSWAINFGGNVDTTLKSTKVKSRYFSNVPH